MIDITSDRVYPYSWNIMLGITATHCGQIFVFISTDLQTLHTKYCLCSQIVSVGLKSFNFLGLAQPAQPELDCIQPAENQTTLIIPS
jgi:hypothetical protein